MKDIDARLAQISELELDKHNANKGTERGSAMLRDSLRKHGAGRSILLDRQGRVIAGNKTLENAAALGMSEIVIVPSDGTKVVAVQRTDLDLDSKEGRELAIADNRVGEANLEWDVEQLRALVPEIDTSPFWTPEELAEILGETQAELQGDEDDVPETPATPVTKLGDLILLGEHRLLCGDSTNADCVARLLGNDKPNLMVTDPPYGVEYDPDWRNRADRANGLPYGARAVGQVENDSRAEWSEAWVLFPGRIAYVWHADRHASAVQASLEKTGFAIRNQLIWAKNNFAISRGDYHWKHEPCWYAIRGTGDWHGDRSQTTLWEIDKPMKSETGHSTQKPVECMERPVRNNSGAGDAVYDPFGGSGTTMIACEKTGRRCRMMEISPAYCDVIVTRWENATGKKAIRP